jgi:hypothetical protein
METLSRCSGPQAAEVAVAGRDSGDDLRSLLERDGLLILRTGPFRLTAGELGSVETHWSDGRSKNSSFNPRTGEVDGVLGEASDVAGLGALMARYSAWAADLLAEFFPAYRSGLELGRTSLRRRSVQDEPPLSQRKDDRSLHLDAFTSQPVAGRRILRLFSNIDPTGAEREWAIADGGFEDYARRFRGRTRRLLPGEAVVLEGLSLTKARRTHYDQDHAGHARRRQARPRLPGDGAAPLRLVSRGRHLARLHRPDPPRRRQRPLRPGAEGEVPWRRDCSRSKGAPRWSPAARAASAG